jgi:hypothetical protein
MASRAGSKLAAARLASAAASQAANDAQAAASANQAANAAAVAAAAQVVAAGGPAPQPPDIAAILAAVLAQNGQILHQQALQAAAALAQQEAARRSAELAAAESLAQQRRAAAGAAPLFHGLARDIAVHTWLISLERWFESAHIATDAGGEADAERIEVAATALRGPAQTWWEATRAADAAQVAAGQPAALGTWSAFTSAVRRHFLPQAPELWAVQQLEKLTSSNMKDVAQYTNQFVAFDMLVSPQSMGELIRVVTYQRSLPELYRVHAAEKQHSTLAAAMDSTLALWNAKSAAAAAAAGVKPHSSAARLSAVSDDNDHGGDSDDVAAQHTQQASAAAAAVTPTAGLQKMMQDAFLSAMQSVRGGKVPKRGDNRGTGGGRGRGGRGRDRQRGGSGGRSPRARTPGVTEEQAQERLAAGVCINCGQPNHFARDCTNPVRKQDGLSN